MEKGGRGLKWASAGGLIAQGEQTSVSMTGSLRGRVWKSESENAAQPAHTKYTLTYSNADEVEVDGGGKISMFFFFFAAIPEKHANEAEPAVMTGALRRNTSDAEL